MPHRRFDGAIALATTTAIAVSTLALLAMAIGVTPVATIATVATVLTLAWPQPKKPTHK